MKLILAPLWVDKYFAEGSRPAEITVQRWLRQGKVPGRKVGGIWYVDDHAWQAGDDDLVRQILSAG